MAADKIAAQRLDRALIRARLERVRRFKLLDERAKASAAAKDAPAAVRGAARTRKTSRPALDTPSEDVCGVSVEQCCVCYMDMTDVDGTDEPANENSIRVLACAHRFHAACIEPWLRRSATCPLCRHPCEKPPPLIPATPAPEITRPASRFEANTSASQGRVDTPRRQRRVHDCARPSVVMVGERPWCEGCNRWLRYFEIPWDQE